MKKPFVIGVAGGPSSGKTSVCKIIMDKLDDDMKHNICLISQESFYKPLSSLYSEGFGYNYDHPDAVDFKQMEKLIYDLKRRKTVEIGRYDMKHRKMSSEVDTISPVDIILVEGTLLLFSKRIQDILDIKLFVDVDADVRLSRRVIRDTELLGRPLNQVLQEYVKFVKPAFEDFVLPTKKRADIILPRGSDNITAINLIIQQVQDWISGKSDFEKPKVEIVSDMLHSSLPITEEKDGVTRNSSTGYQVILN